MNIIRKIILWLPAAAMVGLLLSANAYADATSTGSGTGNNSASSPSGEPTVEPNHPVTGGNPKTGGDSQGAITTLPPQKISQDENTDVLKFRQLGESAVGQNGQNNSKKPTATQVKNCELHKTDIQNKVNAMTSHAQASLKRINAALTEVENYQSKNSLTVTNWDALVSAANTAQATATSSVDALVSLNPPLVCGDSSVSTDVASFKAAVTQARTDLMAYRTAVINLLKAVQAVKPPATSNTQGGQQ